MNAATAAFSPRDIEEYFYQKIPLTRAMEVRVESATPQALVLTAPLSANHNHLGTAFGGSLSALATLAGYGFLWLELGDRDCHVVIRDSAMNFRQPVRREIRAICLRPGEAELAAFHQEFSAGGKSRIRLSVTVEEEGQTCVEFTGTYVALK